jgi:hypothetical protein
VATCYLVWRRIGSDYLVHLLPAVVRGLRLTRQEGRRHFIIIVYWDVGYVLLVMFRLVSAYSLSHNTIKSAKICRLSYLPNQPVTLVNSPTTHTIRNQQLAEKKERKEKETSKTKFIKRILRES